MNGFICLRFVGPLSARDPPTGNYMNYSGTSNPSTDDYMDMNHSNSSTQLQGKVSQYPAKTQGHDLGQPTCMYDHFV